MKIERKFPQLFGIFCWVEKVDKLSRGGS